MHLDFELAPRPVHLAGAVDDGLAHGALIVHGQLDGDGGKGARLHMRVRQRRGEVAVLQSII